MLNFYFIRKKSWDYVKSYHYPTLDALPLMDDNIVLRSLREAGLRALALNSTLLLINRHNSSLTSIEWLQREGVWEYLTIEEKDVFLGNTEYDANFFNFKIQSLYFLAWILGFYSEFSFEKALPSDLIQQFPQNQFATVEVFLEKCKVRGGDEIIEACDLAYCLDWSITEMLLEGKINQLKHNPYVVKHRRLALEWMISNQDWDEIPLDT